MLKEKQHLLGFMSDNIMPLSQAVEGYDMFDKMKVQKGKLSWMPGLEFANRKQWSLKPKSKRSQVC